MNGQLQFAIDQWGLSNLRPIYEREQSAVWSAESDRFGSVILKWNSTGQLESEYRMLSRLQGKGCCKVYSYDQDLGLLLEERVLPGTVLREETSLEKRVEVLASVFREIHVPQQEGETYLDWLNKAQAFCESSDVSDELTRLAGQAREICVELFEKYPERVLLHEDLHHDNLLLRSDGSYAVIDPKGVIGPEILDLPRFLLNEANFDDDPAHMERAIRLVSQAAAIRRRICGRHCSWKLCWQPCGVWRMVCRFRIGGWNWPDLEMRDNQCTSKQNDWN